jgi:hypothetical protein
MWWCQEKTGIIIFRNNSKLFFHMIHFSTLSVPQTPRLLITGWIMSRKGYGRKRSRSNRGTIPGFSCFNWEAPKNFHQGSHDPAVNRTTNLQNSRIERYGYSNSFGVLFTSSRNTRSSSARTVHFLVNIAVGYTTATSLNIELQAKLLLPLYIVRRWNRIAFKNVTATPVHRLTRMVVAYFGNSTEWVSYPRCSPSDPSLVTEQSATDTEWHPINLKIIRIQF